MCRFTPKRAKKVLWVERWQYLISNSAEKGVKSGGVRGKTDRGIKETEKYRYEMKKADGGISFPLKHFDILNLEQLPGSK